MQATPSQRIQVALQEATLTNGLDLRSFGLSSVPEVVWKQTNLQTLLLSNNNLTTLPSSIQELTNLRELRVDGNKLTTLPEELGTLTELSVLDIGGNNLIRVPPCVFRVYSRAQSSPSH
eukprot:TRINITY_DN6212_c0_g1_i1.p1 TRINITY_DN6212_c0_g1~~TRINITY_DN6212_c0_g1_i1.p1  ORF type:complete len:119 (+),score=32.33 TRINITY_DN6212_c0_g1_i1:43-399(+)